MKQLLPSQRKRMDDLIIKRGLLIEDFVFNIPSNEECSEYDDIYHTQIEISMMTVFQNVFLIRSSMQGAKLCDIYYFPSDNDNHHLYLGCDTFNEVLYKFNLWLTVLFNEKQILNSNQ